MSNHNHNDIKFAERIPLDGTSNSRYDVMKQLIDPTKSFS
jgi:hypothetical protein